MKERFTLWIVKILLIIGFGILVIDSDIAYKILIRKNFVIARLFVVIFLIIFFDQRTIEILKLYNKLISKTKRIGKTIDGISTQKLYDFMLKYNGLPTNEFLQTFGQNKDLFKKIGDNLERLGILKRGLKNARYLTSLYDTETLKIMLWSTDTTTTLHAPIIQTGPNSYNFASHKLLTHEN